MKVYSRFHKALIFALMMVPMIVGCDTTHPVYSTRFLAFGTLIDVSILGVSAETAEHASAAIQADFAYMHHAWHAWDPGPLGRVNQLIKSGEPFALPPSVQPLIEKSIVLSEQSGHLFNPAIGKLINLWGFHSDKPDPKPPRPKDIEVLVKAAPRMTDLQMDGIMMSSANSHVQLDFGAFGKGYGIDLAIAHLRELGVRNAIINAGGDLRAIGDRDGQPWRIAIRRPSGAGVFAIVKISGDESVFTSGDYERNFVHKNKRYHHIIDPRTGYPAEGTQSVTVLHSDATTADAAATALFIAGPQHWHAVAKAMGIGYVLLVDQEGTAHMNPLMAERVELIDKSIAIELSAPLVDQENTAAKSRH